MHLGSHPTISDAVRTRFNDWLEVLRQDLSDIGADRFNPDFNNPDVQDVLRQHNQRARNLADVIAATSIDGFGDPSDASNGERLVYNRADPRAASLVDPSDHRWQGRSWAQLKPSEQATLLQENFDRIVNRYIEPNGELKPAARTRINILRELTGDALGEIAPGHRAIAERVIQVAAANNIDLNNRSAGSVIDQFRGSFVDGLDQSLVDELADVRTTGQSLDALRLSRVAGAVAGAFFVFDDWATGAELATAFALQARGDLTSVPFGQGNWDFPAALSEIIKRRGLDAHRPMNTMPHAEEFYTEINGETVTDPTRYAELEGWYRGQYNISTDFDILVYAHEGNINDVRVLTYSSRIARDVVINTPHGDRGRLAAPLFFQVPLGQDIPGSGQSARIALVPDPSGTSFRLIDYERNTVTTVPDPHQQGIRAAFDAISAQSPEARLDALERIREFASVGIQRTLDENGALPSAEMLEQDLQTLTRAQQRVGGDRLRGVLSYFAEVFSLISFGQLGSMFGSNLARLIQTDDPWESIAIGTTLGTLGLNIGQGIDNALDDSANTSFKSAFDDLPQDIASAGIGAISSYLFSEWVNEQGLSDFGAGLVNSQAGAAIGQIADNLVHLGEIVDGVKIEWNTGLNNPSLFLNAAGSFIGFYLASKLVKFDTIGGQIGASLGSGIGALVAVKLAGDLWGAVGAVLFPGIGAFIGYIVGGLIGSLVRGGTPKAGAVLGWDENAQRYAVISTWKKNGGSKDAARSFASQVGELLNGVAAASGARVLNAAGVQTGAYEMKGDRLWYKPSAAAQVSFTTKDAATLISHGAFIALSDLSERLIGGDVYIKRALAATLEQSGGNRNAIGFAAGTFEANTLFGNIATAQDYAGYLQNAPIVNALIAAEPQSAFTAGWTITFARVMELGLDRRWSSDWLGGWAAFLDETADGKIDGTAFAPGNVILELDAETNERLFVFFDGDGSLLGVLGDTIDTASKDVIVGTAGDDAITLTNDSWSETRTVTTTVAVDENRQFFNPQDGAMFTLSPEDVYAGEPLVLGAGLVLTGANTVEVTRDVTLQRSGWRIADASGLTVNGEAATGSTRQIRVAAVIDGGAGDDAIRGGDLGNDLLGGAGSDTLIGGKLDDWLMGGDGDDRLFAGNVANTNFSDTAAASEAARNAALAVDGGNGDYLEGGDGDDALYGGKGSDWLSGGDGNDILRGGAGGDILAGGAGDDQGASGEAHLLGGAGSDQYIFNLGDGEDVLYDESDPSVAAGSGLYGARTRLIGLNAGNIQRNWAGDGDYEVDGSVAGGEDAISFGVGIDMRDLVLRRSEVSGQVGSDLIIELTQRDENGAAQPTGDTLTIKDWFDETRRVEWLRFADGQEIRIGDMTSFIIGTAENDVIIGTAGADFALGGDGDDDMHLLAGDDFGFGGRGRDIVAGDDDNDWVLGGDDDDIVEGGAGHDTVFGDDGDDYIAGADGNDVLSGGRGNDVVVGGTGNDLYKYARGDGRDTLFDAHADATTQVMFSGGEWINGYERSEGGQILYLGSAVDVEGYDWNASTQTLTRLVAPSVSGVYTENAGDDTLEFGFGIDIEDVQLRRSNGDLELALVHGPWDASSFDAITDHITLREWFSTGAQIEHFVFIETGTIDVYAMALGAVVTDGDDVVSGTTGKDWITGGLGDDELTGGAADDILSGNHGHDELDGGAGADVLFGGAGNDTIDGGADADYIMGGDGFDIASYASDAHSGAGVRVSLAFARVNTLDAAGDVLRGIEGLEGTSRDDELIGDDGDNILRGLAGNDLLRGDAGDDTYEIGANEGADVIEEGAFSPEEILNSASALNSELYSANWEQIDIEDLFGVTWYCYQLTVTRSNGTMVYQSRANIDFKYTSPSVPMPGGASWPFANGQWKQGAKRTGTGAQTIVEFSQSGEDGRDTIELGDGISLSDITAALENSNHDLRLTFAGGGTVLIKNQDNANKDIEHLILADGLAADLTRLKLAGASGSGDADFFIGSVSGDIFDGSGGDDIISGGGGADQIAGGDGDDVLEGGAGADDLNGGGDSVTTDHSALAGDLTGNYGDTIRYVGSDAGVTINLATGAASGGHAQGDTLTDIENVIGSRHADTLTGDSGANRLSGLDGNDTLIGGAGDDVLGGGAGDDTLSGGDGEDNIIGEEGADTIDGGAGADVIAAGDGNDGVAGGAGEDIIDAGAGADTVHGDAGADQIGGGDGDDTLYGDAGDDQIDAGAGNDTVNGGDGADVIVGGAGDDVLQGGAGDDTYCFDAFSGVDSIVDAAGVNAIHISGVSVDQVWITRSADDLKLGLIGSDTRVTVTNFYALSNPSLVRAIRVVGPSGDHTLYLAHAGALITAMGTESISPPAAMPTEVADLLSTYWHLGGKAAPFVSDREFTIEEDPVPAYSDQVEALDHDDQPLTYAVAMQAAHGEVEIDENTGAWTYAPDPDFNGEDYFDLSVEDADGLSVRQRVTMTVNAVNDAPVASVGALQIDELAADGTAIAMFTVTDVDDASGATLSLINSAGGRFRLTNGVLEVDRSSAQIDFEAGQSHTITVRATDTHGAYRDQNFTVTILDHNEAPTGLNFLNTTTSIDENTSTGSAIKVADIGYSDDALGTESLALSGADAASFEIVGSSLYLKAGVTLNYEAKSSYVVTVTVDDASVGSTPDLSQNFTLNVGDLNEAPTGLSFSNTTTSIAENTSTASPIKVADIGYTDDALGTESVSLSGADVAFFEVIDGSLYLKAGVPLNYEAKSSFNVNVSVDDAAVGSTPDLSQAFSLSVVDQNEAPTSLSFTDTTTGLAENVSTAERIKLANIVVSDDALGTNVLALSGSDPGVFEIVGAALYLKAGVTLNYNTQNSYTVTVSVDDATFGAGPEHSQNFTLNISDVNSAPTAINFTSATNSLAENTSTASRIKLADIVVTDDGTGQLNLDLTGADAASFEIMTGSLYLKAGVTLNFEAKSSYSVNVTVDDPSLGSGVELTESFTLNVADVNEAPTGLSFTNTTTSLQENTSTASRTKMADLSYSDDALGSESYGLSGSDSASFEIISGVLYLKAGVTLDYEAKPSYSVDVTVDDSALGSGPELSQTFTLTLADVNELPHGLGLTATSMSVAENSATGFKVADIYYYDDALGTESWTLTGADANSFELIGAAIYLKSGVTLNYEAKTTYNVTLNVDDPTLGSSPDLSIGFTLNVTDVNEAPTGLNLSNTTTTLAENTSTSSRIHVANIAYSDDALGSENHAVSGADAASFEIDGGALYLKAGVGLNYEAQNAYNVTVTVDDPAVGSSPDLSQSFTLNVTDVNELPYSLSLSQTSMSVAENSSAGFKVADISYYDDALGTESWSLTGADASSFELIGASIYLRSNVTLNYEAKTSYSVTFNVDDTTIGSTPDLSIGFTLNVTDINEAPTGLSFTNTTTSLAENASTSSRTKMADLIVTDDAAGTNSFGLTGTDAASFEIISGVLYLKAGVGLNYETKSSYAVTVTVDDTAVGSTPDLSQNFSLSITNVNEAPTVTPYTRTSNLPGTNGLNVGTPTISDPDGDTSFTWQILSISSNTSPPDATYSIDSSTGQLTCTYSTGTAWKRVDSVVVRATDAGGASHSTTITLIYNNNKPWPPIVFDLDGDGLELVSVFSAPVKFDVDGDDVLDDTGWVGADDGFLALDRDGDGLFTRGEEIGFAHDAEGAASDLEGLRAYDTNEDGFFSGADAQFAQFRVWQDANQDGVSQTDEIATLAQRGIVAINLTLSLTGQTPANMVDNIVYGTAAYVRADGTVGQVGDVFLAYGSGSENAQLPPIVFDLDGGGVTLTRRLFSNVQFDADGDGVAERIGWFGPGEGVLALDRDGNGVVSNGLEISFVQDVAGAGTDLEGLGAYDSNGDGFFGEGDARYGDFWIWQDANQDGVSQPGELQSLAKRGVRALNLTASPTGQSALGATDNVIVSTAQFVRSDGGVGVAADVVLAYDVEPSEAPSVHDAAPNGVGDDLVSRLANSQLRRPSAPQTPRDPLRWMFEQAETMPASNSSSPRSFVHDDYTPLSVTPRSSRPFSVHDRVQAMLEAIRSGSSEDPSIRAPFWRHRQDDQPVAPATGSALHRGLTLADRRVLHMVDAMATFGAEEAGDMDVSRKRDQRFSDLLTSLPDVRHG